MLDNLFYFSTSVFSLISFSYALQLLSLASLALAQKKLLPAPLANATRLVCFGMTVLFTTTLLAAHVTEFVRVGIFFGPAATIYMVIVLPFCMLLLLRWQLKYNAQLVLTHGLLSLPLYVFLLLVNGGTFTVIPSLLILLISWLSTLIFVPSIDLGQMAEVLHGISKTYVNNYTVYANMVASLQAAPSKKYLVLSTICNLNISLLNLGYVLSQKVDVSSIVVLILVTGGLLIQALFACELLRDAKCVTYQYGLFLQVFLNFGQRFLHLCNDFKTNQLGNISFVHATVMVALAFTSGPQAAFCMESEVVPFSGALESCQPQPAPTSRAAQPVGEGIADKLFSNSSIGKATNFGKQIVGDIAKEAYTKGIEKAAYCVVTGAATGALWLSADNIKTVLCAVSPEAPTEATGAPTEGSSAVTAEFVARLASASSALAPEQTAGPSSESGQQSVIRHLSQSVKSLIDTQESTAAQLAEARAKIDTQKSLLKEQGSHIAQLTAQIKDLEDDLTLHKALVHIAGI